MHASVYLAAQDRKHISKQDYNGSYKSTGREGTDAIEIVGVSTQEQCHGGTVGRVGRRKAVLKVMAVSNN